MNLASRCREAITQAAGMKKDLSIQKRKTAEAVAQTHLLLDQLKKMKQQQKEDETKLLALQQQHISQLSKELTGEQTTTLTNDLVSTAPAVSSIRTVGDIVDEMIVTPANAPVINPTEPLQSAVGATTLSEFSSVASKTTSPPPTETTSGVADSDSVVPIPMDSVMNHDIDQDAMRIPGPIENFRDIADVSSSPQMSNDKSSVEVTTTPTSTKSNVVDLDITYDFDNDTEEKINDETFDNTGDEYIKAFADPTPLSTTEEVIIEAVDDCVPNEEELKLLPFDLINATDTNILNVIIPTKLDECHFPNSSSTLQRDIFDSKNDYVQNDTSASPSEKAKFSTITSTNVFDESDHYDDSEHKCDDSNTDHFYNTGLPPVNTTPTLGTAIVDEHVLVSSDDYECSNSAVDEHEHNDNDGDSDKVKSFDEAIANVATNFDLIGTTTTIAEVQDDDEAKIPCRNTASEAVLPISSSLSQFPMEVIDSSVSSLGLTDAVPALSDVSKYTPRKMKNHSWTEDYDEAAGQEYDDDDDETSDTLSGLIISNSSCMSNSNILAKVEYFPHSASPKVSTKLISNTPSESIIIGSESLPTSNKMKRLMPPFSSSLSNESYEDEFPSDIIKQPRYFTSSSQLSKMKSMHLVRTNDLTEEINDIDASPPTLESTSMKFFGPLQEHNQSTNLISSIDAFEASFQTNFPESFTPKESPNTSPISGIKARTTDSNAGSISDPFLLNTPVTSLDDETLKKEIVLSAEESSPSSDAGVENMNSGVRGKVLQQNFCRRGVQHTSDVVDKDSILHHNATKNISSEQSARWLLEVKSSTEKHKSSVRTNIDSVTTQLETVHLPTTLDVEEKSGYAIDGESFGHSTISKPLSIRANVVTSHESSRPALINEPVFRQFPQPISAAKPIKLMSAHTSRINLMDNTLSVACSDKIPLIGGRASDEYSSFPSISPQQKGSENSNTSVRSRYVSALDRHSSSLPLERGRLSISRQTLTKENSFRSSTSESFTTVVAETNDLSDRETVKDRNLPVNVRERVAIYSKVSSPLAVVSPSHDKGLTNGAKNSNSYNSRSNFRAASRTTVQLLEDEGDIPMQTSLSPRKVRSGEYSHQSTIEQTSRNERVEKDAVGVPGMVQAKSKNQLYKEHHDRRSLQSGIDVGKERRHINLSGKGRMSRKVDHEKNAAHVYENVN